VRSKELLRASIENPLKFRVITYFGVGPIFAACIDKKQKALLFRTNQLCYLAEHKEETRFLEEPEVRNLSAKSEKLIVVKTSGEVGLWTADKQSMELELAKSTVAWSM
jgi:hypothetical protein